MMVLRRHHTASVRNEQRNVIYRGEELKCEHVQDGRALFFQRPLEFGRGYWLVRTFRDSFVLEPEAPVSLSQG